jgi:hypothetical protein
MREWARGIAVGLIALAGLWVAATTHRGLMHYLGFAVAFLAIFLCFRLIARAYDGPGESTPLIPVPASDSGRQWAGGLAAVLGLVGLFVAAGGHGGGATWIGLLLAAGAWLYVFRLIAASFGQRH